MCENLTMTANIDKKISEFLELAVRGKMEFFEVHFHNGNKKGEGFGGEMTFVSLKNKQTGENIDLVIKQVIPSGTDSTRVLMSTIYSNEIQYYSKILPALLDFQKSYPDVGQFDNCAKCYATSLEAGFEKLALENLKLKNYEMHPKQKPFDTKSTEKFFRMYGEYHALGFAFKHHHPQEFLKITKDLHNILDLMEDMEFFLKSIFTAIKANLEESGDHELIDDRFRRILDSPLKFYVESATYKGLYGTILHRDCWSNNYMIKYDLSREIEHIKMLDFQTVSISTPVLDLSYNLYAGANKESLDNFENLLKLYHNVLSETLKKYGCDPEKIYPYEVFVMEWKKYCKFGFLSGLTVWILKLATDLTEMPSINEILDNGGVPDKELMGMKYNKEEFTIVAKNLLKHMYKNNFL